MVVDVVGIELENARLELVTAPTSCKSVRVGERWGEERKEKSRNAGFEDKSKTLSCGEESRWKNGDHTCGLVSVVRSRVGRSVEELLSSLPPSREGNK